MNQILVYHIKGIYINSCVMAQKQKTMLEIFPTPLRFFCLIHEKLQINQKFTITKNIRQIQPKVAQISESFSYS